MIYNGCVVTYACQAHLWQLGAVAGTVIIIRGPGIPSHCNHPHNTFPGTRVIVPALGGEVVTTWPALEMSQPGSMGLIHDYHYDYPGLGSTEARLHVSVPEY